MPTLPVAGLLALSIVAAAGLPATGESPIPAPPAGPQVVSITTLPTDSQNSFYISNHAPLAPSPLTKLPIGAITPKGWLRTQLTLMKDGMAGHMPELSHWVNPDKNAWLAKDGEGQNGWEELPYWLKGYGDLGWVLKDPEIIAKTKAWLDGVMATQRPDGYFGPESNRQGGPENMQYGEAGKLKAPDLWPHMPMLDALKSYHEATDDPRILKVLTDYFKWENSLPRESLLIASWQKLRGGDNLESVLWLYNRTGEPWLLDLAHKLHDQTSPWTQKVASWHGVNICQGFREPAVYWLLSHDKKDLDATERNYQEVMALYGQVPGGMFGADENARKGFGDPRQAAETCSMVEYMNSFEQLLRFTGDPLYAERCEEVAFNSLPAAFTADYKALHYLTSPNMVQLDQGSKSPGLANGGTMISYDPGEVYRCCQHNHAMGWPYFAEHQWMATADNGLAAVLYGQCDVHAKAGPKDSPAEVTIEESTGYPFDELFTFRITTSRPATFPIYLRIPAWCTEAQVQIRAGGIAAYEPAGAPGTYAKITREWKTGDEIGLMLPMRIEAKTWRANQNSVSIKRGPLWYSLKIGERSEPYKGSGPWPGHEVYSTTPWNYGLVYNPADVAGSFRVVQSRGPIPRQPYTADDVPIRLLAKGRRIPAWKQDRLSLVGLLQPSPVASDEPEEPITLIPMGAARLRISAFPVIGAGPDAHHWVEPPPSRHDASYIFDDIDAVSDGKEPKSSNDHSIPRYTWWDHKGTTEWVTYKLGKPRRLTSTAVYWFDDTGIGQCRTPASWRLFYRDGEVWKPVTPKEQPGTKPDQYNRITFEPITTIELKIEVTLQQGFSGGILEWKAGE